MKRSFLGLGILVFLLACGRGVAHAKKKPTPTPTPNARQQVWSSTAGSLTNPQPVAADAAAPDAVATAAGNVALQSCPNGGDIPYDTETVIAQGDVAANPNTVSTWGLGQLYSPTLMNQAPVTDTVVFKVYMGVEGSCTSFATCAPTWSAPQVSPGFALNSSNTPSPYSLSARSAELGVSAKPSDLIAWFVTATVTPLLEPGEPIPTIDPQCVMASNFNINQSN